MRHILRKIILTLSCCLLLLVTTAQTQAQPTPFEAILYNSNVGEIIAVNHNGVELDRITLPSLGSQTFSDEIEVSDDGNRIAYVLTDTNSDAKDLMLYDRSQATIVGQYRLPTANDRLYHSLDFRARSTAFDPTTNRFAFGYSIDYQDWHLMVYDISRGAVISTIDHTTHPTLPGTANVPDLPIPRQFDGQFVDATFIATGTEGFPEYPAYRWDTSSNTVRQNQVVRDLQSDYLGSEHILTVPDYSLPNVNDQSQSPFAQINSVHASPNDTGTTFPVYNQQNDTLTTVRFIENGRRAVVARTPFLSSGLFSWHVFDRDGNQIGTLGIGNLTPHEILSVPDGLIYSATATDIRNATGYIASRNAATTALMYIDTTQSFANSAGTRLWLGDPNEFPELVWVSDRQSSALPMPTAWARLDSTVPPVVENPCLNQPALCNLQVGIEAEINTTEGDLLNLRSGPGTNYDVIDQLPNGEAVELREGPQQVNGLSWWRIETTAGQIGWVVERVNDVQVLLAMSSGNVNPSTGLFVGGQARVSEEGDNLNAHTRAGVDTPVLAILQEGDVVDVLAGPRNVDGYTWWQVETPEGAAWVAQGDGVDRWLQPSAQ